MRAFGVRDPLRAALRAGLPAYGSCAGMILLADRVLDGPPDQETLGGIDMTVRRNAFGRQVASFEGDVEVDGVPGGPMHGVSQPIRFDGERPALRRPPPAHGEHGREILRETGFAEAEIERMASEGIVRLP